jgi:hypothetical protein
MSSWAHEGPAREKQSPLACFILNPARSSALLVVVVPVRRLPGRTSSVGAVIVDVDRSCPKPPIRRRAADLLGVTSPLCSGHVRLHGFIAVVPPPPRESPKPSLRAVKLPGMCRCHRSLLVARSLPRLFSGMVSGLVAAYVFKSGQWRS